MAVGAIIAAAGASHGVDEFRPMMKVFGTTMIKKEITTLREGGADRIVVITGDRAELLEKHISRNGVTCIRNEDYKTTHMMDSLRLGIRALRDTCDQILIVPGDVPLFTTESVRAILASPASAAIPRVKGKSGHPIMIRQELFDRMLEGPADESLRDILTSDSLEVDYVEIDDRGVLLDTNTHEDYRDLIHYEQTSMRQEPLSFHIDVSLLKNQAFFDEELLLLLRETDEAGSIYSACRRLNISYSRAWKKINHAENETGFHFLNRRAGGSREDHSKLTAEGKAFLKKYEAFSQALSEWALNHFPEYFGES